MNRSRFIFFITFILISVLMFSSCAFSPFSQETVTTQENREFVTDANGKEIPVYENVDESILSPEKFVLDENGRMKYDDESAVTFTGIDVSVFQGDIDWEQVKNDGIDFVMIRAGFRGYGPDGTLNEDKNFRTNCENALKAGLNVGVYFFSQAVNEREAKEEARFVLNLVKDYPINYPIAYDWETIDYTDTARTNGMTNEQITACANAFCSEIESAGYEPIIYFNRELGYFNYDLSLINNYHFWLAEYHETPSFYYDYKIWQYTDEGSVDGIVGYVDLNISIVDYSSKGSVG